MKNNLRAIKNSLSLSIFVLVGFIFFNVVFSIVVNDLENKTAHAE